MGFKKSIEENSNLNTENLKYKGSLNDVE